MASSVWMDWKIVRWLAVLLLVCTPIFATDVTLAWDANTQPQLRGYTLYYGFASGTYTTIKDVGNVTTYKVTGLDPANKYYFLVQAYGVDDSGEPLVSSYSNEVSWPETPLSPPTLRIQSIISQNGDILYDPSKSFGTIALHVVASGSADH